MDELEKQLKSILDSPGELQRLAEMAQGILGGGVGDGSATPHQSPAATASPQGEAKAGAALMEKLAGLLGSGGGGRDKTALIDALAPYVGEKRQKKLRRAASLARAARLAGTLLAENGELP